MQADNNLMLSAELSECFGRRRNWPESATIVTPYLRIIFASLTVEDAEAFFDSARSAYRMEKAAEAARTYPLGFPCFLSSTLGESWEQDNTLQRNSALQAMLAVHHLAGADPGADFEQYLDCGARVCQEAVEAASGQATASTARRMQAGF